MANRARILFLSYSGPLPANDGKRQRTMALLNALEEVYTVDFLIIDNQEAYTQALSEYKSSDVNFLLFEAPRPKLLSKVQKQVGLLFSKDYALSSHIQQLIQSNNYLFIFARYIQPVVCIPEGQKLVCDIDDDFNELFSTRIITESSWLKRLRLKQIYWLNRPIYERLLRRLDLALFSKVENRKWKGVVVPNLPFQLLLNLTTSSFRPCTSSRILFVGKLTYEPNVKGLAWFLSQVWPLLRMNLPEIHLTVVSNVAVKDTALVELLNSQPDILLKVKVKDLEAEYQEHAITVAPIFQGGGSSIKIAESLFMGRPVVTTSFGARGFGEAVDISLVSSYDSPVEFSNGIAKQFVDVERLKQKQFDTYTWAQTRYYFYNWKKNIQQALTDHLALDVPS